ncbi:hypothetical protein MTBLM1_80008 [Rhodospirillaceae bacterium LM-1]|nr:hypothetical protein MTBLM1_80008 [Rhodospirillaceae bacterium LM-1]
MTLKDRTLAWQLYVKQIIHDLTGTDCAPPVSTALSGAGDSPILP